ncbi:uncharacterized protein [Apostichopus japonicus]|uniref:uncharacterized protein n=1 Tax=Stichopus japonicus TaxID=307972 RepID=UPI003AB90BB1
MDVVFPALAFIAAIFPFTESGSYKPNAERMIRDHILHDRNYSSRERPVLNASDTLEVTLCVFLNAMLHLNQKDQTIKTATWVAFKWTDPRLTWDPKDFDGQDLIVLHHDEVWLPVVHLGNGLETVTVINPSHGRVVLASTGEIYLGSAFIQSSYCPIRIKYFPFDSQVCQLKFNSGNIPAEKLLLKAGVAIMSPALSSSEWQVLAMNGTERIFYEDDVISNRPMLPYSQVRFCLYLKRHPRHYILLLIIPSTILNLMTIMTFLSPADSGERMSLSVSMILGLTVFHLLVADMLPVTEGRDNPILSNYLTGNFVLSVLAIPCSLYSVNVMCSYDNNVKTNQILAGIMYFMRFFGILKKPKKMSAKVTVDEFLRQDSLPCDDVINGRPDERKDITENRQVHRGLSDGQLHMHKKNIDEARLVANALDRIFFVIFLMAIIGMFVLMVIKFRLETVTVINPSHGRVVLASTGEIYLGSAFIQSSYCPIRIKYFPFDSQVCQLKFNSGNIPAEKLLLKAGVAIMSPALSSSEWQVLAMNGTERIFYEDDVISNRPMLPYSQVRFCLYLKRHPRHYILLLIIPSTILNLMTIMTFLSPADSGERMSLSVSMILGLTVFQLLVADMLPVTEGRDNPILSNYLTGNFVLSVLAIPCSLYSVNVMCSYDNNVKTNQILAGIMYFMRFFGILKKPKKMSAKVTVDEFLRQDSLPCDDVINGRPDERKDITENRQVHRGLSDGQLHMHKKNIDEARLVANALDRIFFVIFLMAIIGMFVLMVIKFRFAANSHITGGCY